ncbi:hemerythrin domain-containing protein [Streptomyces sp. NPDC058676]|uniref:hemerythrin domain-containing protein n=1 Tax=unclassified Streptomyces TaxID=2593676 RepID=UPI00364B0786
MSAPLRQHDQPTGRVDFTMMFLTHDAFLRDLRRLAEAVADGRTGEAAVRTGWETFKHQLHVHHVGEDEAIWPPLREALAGSAEIAVLDLMETEHAAIDPLQDRIDAAFDEGGPQLAELVEEFTALLATHMDHEEEQALPLVETHLGPEGWAAYSQYMLATGGLPEAGGYLAWLLDGAPADVRATVLGPLPPPVRHLIHNQFEPQYAAVPRWTDAAPAA